MAQSTFCHQIVRCDGGTPAPYAGTPREAQRGPQHGELDLKQHENKNGPCLGQVHDRLCMKIGPLVSANHLTGLSDWPGHKMVSSL